MITIQPFSPEHAAAIGPFVLGIQHEHNVPITLADQPDLADIDRAYVNSGGNFWLALHNGTLVGTIAIINAGNRIGVIRKMFVAPDYRGAPHRVGQKLLDVLASWARAHTFQTLYLGTLDWFAAARRFYEKNGFALLPEANLPKEMHGIKMRLDNTYYAMELAA